MSAHWRRGPGGVWLLYGDSNVFADALDTDGHVAVRLKDGTHTTVEIERYTTPNHEGYGYAWPVGTVKPPQEAQQLATVVEPQRPQYVSTKSYRRRLAIKRRNRTARGPAQGP